VKPPRLWPLLALVLLVGCRDVRVQTLAQGTTTVLDGGNQIVVVRDSASLERLGIRAPVRFRSEFGVVLLMGPHDRSGYRQIIESIRAPSKKRRQAAASRRTGTAPTPCGSSRIPCTGAE
jgi:hypothetical protein